MTIDGTNISTFGLIVTKLTSNFNLPGRKKILSEPAFGTNDQTLNENTYVVTLFGQYSSQSLLATNVQALQTLIETDVEHDFVFASRGYTFTGVVRNGFKATVKRNDVLIVFEIGIIL